MDFVPNPENKDSNSVEIEAFDTQNYSPYTSTEKKIYQCNQESLSGSPTEISQITENLPKFIHEENKSYQCNQEIFSGYSNQGLFNQCYLMVHNRVTR